jgi:hypothetical protein
VNMDVRKVKTVNIDIRHYALKALEIAKQDMQQEKFLIPVAFIVTADGVLDFTLDFKDSQQKASVYAELVEIANQKGGEAIITINEANLRDPTGADSERPNYGERATESLECLYLAVSRPNADTWSVCVPYRREGDRIVFGSATESQKDLLNLLPGWQIKRPPIS